ncbi:FMN-dependent NADH-azoreductase [Paraburkholderia sp. BL18I3N2]|uniref:FMN-dependent NADH-azoreductase n=1 Tax=Paraburkholderia sp. BL18I3N2 TaxID=1938799 RepID=UPI000D07F16B|nr:NAD(P)H-dependent oxidoreductase [Paraburkholderia sp. BL18I3N2]PRX27319.1 FMN-dependent NADH-azoreductase [Paraburkholderia sp. BL18I3N2]
MQILHLDSSILGDTSASRGLSATIVDALLFDEPDAVVVYRDLAVDAIPHLDGPIAAGFRGTGSAGFDVLTLAEHARSANLVDELLASDVIVIGAPMYNFSVPSQLKAWIDRIAQPGRTFRYTENGPVGLTIGKRVIVASTRGGMYSSGPAAETDFQEAYLRAVFGFLGINDVRFVRAERMTKGADARKESLDAARAAARSAAKASTITG